MYGVSVIVPTLNEQNNIASCIASIRAQADYAKEIIVVDCGSTDNTVKLVKDLQKYVDLKPEIRLLESSQKSYAAAVNLGTLHAAYNYVQLVDGDSELAENWLKLSLNHQEKHKCDMVHGHIALRNTSRYGELRKSAKKVNLAIGGPAIFRTEALRFCNYDPELKRSSDVDVYIRMRANKFEVCPLNKPMLLKDDRDNSTINYRKVLNQGYYSGLMLVKNSSSRQYVTQFVRLRRSYLLYTAFLFSLALGPLLPRQLMLLYFGSPLLVQLLRNNLSATTSLLWFTDRMLRSTAFAAALLRHSVTLCKGVSKTIRTTLTQGQGSKA